MTVKAPNIPSLSDIRAAAATLERFGVQTPLVEFDSGGQSGQIFLKLENLQTVGAFKVRPMGNVLLNAHPESLRQGVYTASSGNAGLALAWIARKLELAATVYAPNNAPEEKVAAMRGLGATIRLLPEPDWWRIIENRGHKDEPGAYVDAVRDPLALAGNGTIGLEIVKQAPDADTVIIPFGGGGLSCGIAAAIRALKPAMRIIVAECDVATPLTNALRAGRPVSVDMKPSFITGAGAPTVLREMWPLVSELVDNSVVVPLGAVADAVRRLFATGKLIVEGAGAISVAGALTAEHDFRKTVCVVSGGNIDSGMLAGILDNEE